MICRRGLNALPKFHANSSVPKSRVLSTLDSAAVARHREAQVPGTGCALVGGVA